MKKLYCADCNKLMAEIRDAMLRKGMVVLCGDCGKEYLNQEQYRTPEVDYLMKTIFGNQSPTKPLNNKKKQ